MLSRGRELARRGLRQSIKMEKDVSSKSSSSSHQGGNHRRNDPGHRGGKGFSLVVLDLKCAMNAKFFEVFTTCGIKFSKDQGNKFEESVQDWQPKEKCPTEDLQTRIEEILTNLETHQASILPLNQR